MYALNPTAKCRYVLQMIHSIKEVSIPRPAVITDRYCFICLDPMHPSVRNRREIKRISLEFDSLICFQSAPDKIYVVHSMLVDHFTSQEVGFMHKQDRFQYSNAFHVQQYAQLPKTHLSFQ